MAWEEGECKVPPAPAPPPAPRACCSSRAASEAAAETEGARSAFSFSWAGSGPLTPEGKVGKGWHSRGRAFTSQ